jgi:hypothetical protein
VFHPRTVRMVAALTLFVGVGTAACTEPAAKPKPLPSPSSSSVRDNSSPSASPTPPSMPAEANGNTGRAAKSFVRHYIETLNYATATGDTIPLAALDDGSCRSCSAVIGRVRNVYEAGGSIESRGWIVKSLAVVGQPKRPLVDAGLLLSPQRVTKKQGDRPVRYKGGRLPVTFHLIRLGHGWRVDEWARAA